jgi:hypothetical protein
MQLGLNLINEEKFLDLMDDFSADEASDETPQPELLEEDEGREKKEMTFSSELDIGMLELLIDSLIEKKDKKAKSLSENSEEEEKDNKSRTAKDSTLKSIVKEIDRKFGAKHKKTQKNQKNKAGAYLDPELMKSAYGLNITELFSYLNTKSATDVYKEFYTGGQKDKIYNFVDEPLDYAKLQKIQNMTKIARYSGYMGDTEYCGHELLDADTKEKWHLIRNMTHVFIMTLVRYDIALQ